MGCSKGRVGTPFWHRPPKKGRSVELDSGHVPLLASEKLPAEFGQLLQSLASYFLHHGSIVALFSWTLTLSRLEGGTSASLEHTQRNDPQGHLRV